MIESTTAADASESVRNLVELYELGWGKDGSLEADDDHLFVKADHDSDVTPTPKLPSIALGESIYFRNCHKTQEHLSAPYRWP